MVSFADDRIRLVGVRANADSPLIGRALKPFGGSTEYRQPRRSDYRQDRAIVPDGDTLIEAGDEVFSRRARISRR